MKVLLQTIQLQGELHPELTRLGLKQGDKVSAEVYNTESKVAQFDHYAHGMTHHCSVWPENYSIIKQ